MFERIRSKILLKIGTLIIIETIFIISSFGVLASFQSEDSSLGNSINIAGKNRYLTAIVLLEAEKYLDSQSPTDLSKLKVAINSLESNILVLKQGGKTSGLEVKPLSPEFSGLWDIINEKEQTFKRFIDENIIRSTNQQLRLETAQEQSIRTELESTALSLVGSSDTFVTNLGRTTEHNSQNLLLLEVALAIVSGIILMFILYLVFKILRPIFSLIAATSEAKKGNLDTNVNIKGSDELSTLSESFNSMIVSIRDYVKKQKQMQNEIQNANKNLLAADRAKEEFMSMISHELKSPLGPMKLYTEMLLKTSSDTSTLESASSSTATSTFGKRKKGLLIIHRNILRLENLVSDILDVYKLDIGTLKLNKTYVSVAEQVEENISELNALTKDKQIELVAETKTARGLSIWCDPYRIAQVICNLVRNSIDFVPEKTGKITIRTGIADDAYYSETRIHKEKEKEEKEQERKTQMQMVLFEIEDNGIGIPPDKIDSLFKNFYQLDTTLTRKHGGTGLGLVICKGIIEAHGGKIWIDKEYTNGTRIKFILPGKMDNDNYSYDYKNG